MAQSYTIHTYVMYIAAYPTLPFAYAYAYACACAFESMNDCCSQY